MTRRFFALAVALLTVFAAPAGAYFAGGGKDAAKGNDCLIGYAGIDADQVTVEGKKQTVMCTDCDPTCDFDGDDTANGSCTFGVGVCINQSGVEGCTAPNALDKASAKGKVKGVKGSGGKVEIDVSQLLDGSACSSFVDVVVPVKETKNGAKDGSASFTLSASVKKDKAEGTPKRSDKDKLVYVCAPRPEGEACPSVTTTSTTLVPTTSTILTSTTSTTLVSTTSTTLASTTSTTLPSTTSTTLVSTTSTTFVPSTSTTLASTTSTSLASTTSTTLASTTSTTLASTTTSTTTSTTAPPETTTSTTVVTTTSSSLPSTTSTSTTTSTTTSTVIPALCGNNALDGGETCDDGNNSDNDACPANCFVAACTPLAGTTRQVTVSFTPPPGLDVAGLTLLMNYPEEKVFMPPAGAQAQIGAENFVPSYPPAEVLIRGADLTHAVRGLVADSTAVPAGPIFALLFQDCEGAAAPQAGEFNCTVLDATDPFTTPVLGVTCSVTLP